MKRKLLLLNLALLSLTAAAGWRLRHEWLAAHARERAVLQKESKTLPPPPIGKLPEPEPVRAASYVEIAEKMLFSKDRNPTVVVETAPPPPPKPMPPLPILHGVMNLGDGLTAILSEKSGSVHKDYRPGETVGPFTLVAINNDQITLEWEGTQVIKKIDEMIEKNEPKQSASAGPARQAPEPPPPPPPKGEAKPGVDIGEGNRACQPGDSSPAGTTADGMRKVVIQSPFGARCWWEPAK